MSRREFTKDIKRNALRRSGKLCEAIGTDYGLEPGQRCNWTLSAGVQFDHIIADSIGGEPTLENCAAVCPQCHAIKTATVDTPRAAETKRMSDKHLGIRKPSRFPGARNDHRKAKIGGGWVDRKTGEPL